MLNYNIKIYPAVFHALALTIIMALSEGLIAALPHISIYLYRENNIYNSSGLTFVILSKSVYLLVSQFVTRIFDKQIYYLKDDKPQKSILMLHLIPVISTVITLLLGSICINANISYSTNIIIFICLTLLLLINILTFYLQQDISKKNVEYARLQIELQKENDTVEYYRRHKISL